MDSLFGISQGYLSRLLAQAGNPSSVLVLLLGLIARAPETRLGEVHGYWQAPRPDPALLASRSNEAEPFR